jgi:hypothetical protein
MPILTFPSMITHVLHAAQLGVVAIDRALYRPGVAHSQGNTGLRTAFSEVGGLQAGAQPQCQTPAIFDLVSSKPPATPRTDAERLCRDPAMRWVVGDHGWRVCE